MNSAAISMPFEIYTHISIGYAPSRSPGFTDGFGRKLQHSYCVPIISHACS